MARQDISRQINVVGVQTVIVMVVTGVLSVFLPIDAPAPTQEATSLWLMNTAPVYLVGWINQIIAMLALNALFTVTAWQIFSAAPIRAVVVWTAMIIATAVFIITKFLSLWSVPLMAKAIASGSVDSASAEALLTALGPSVSFGLMPSLDYLGFWFYGLSAFFLLVPLFRLSLGAKVAAVVFLAYAIVFHLVLVAALIDILSLDQVLDSVLGAASLLIVGVIAMLFHFIGELKQG